MLRGWPVQDSPGVSGLVPTESAPRHRLPWGSAGRTGSHAAPTWLGPGHDCVAKWSMSRHGSEPDDAIAVIEERASAALALRGVLGRFDPGMSRSTARRITFKGGTVVSGAGQRSADLLVEDGTVAAVGELDVSGEVVDASGLLILPGMVDTHVHLMDPGSTHREDFPTGTRAAAARGVTTVVEHTHSHPVRTVGDLLDKRSYLEGRSNVDFGLAAHVWPESIPGIPDLVESGITFFKIFTCDTHGVPGLDAALVAEALARIAETDTRALVHNEDQSLTATAETRLRSENRSDPGLLTEWRGRDAELVAVASTAALALHSRAKITCAHVSNPLVLDVIDAFRRLGARIAAEACPQYFVLEENEVVEHASLRKFTPPARIRSEADRGDMWDAVAAGRFSYFSTDHAPSTLEQKASGSFWDAPFGLPGLDTTLPFLVDAAVTGRITWSDLVRLYSAEPARWYRLPKGSLEVGADADIVLVDPNGSWVVDESDIISKAGWSPYSGRRFRGRVVATYLRGASVAIDGVAEDARLGQFITPR